MTKYFFELRGEGYSTSDGIDVWEAAQEAFPEDREHYEQLRLEGSGQGHILLKLLRARAAIASPAIWKTSGVLNELPRGEFNILRLSR